MLSPARPENLDETGCTAIHDFIAPDRLDAINHELDHFFDAPSFNGPFFCTIHDRHVRSVTAPALLTSVNILELAVDIAGAIAARNPRFNPDDYYVMNIAVYSESGNPHALGWHTDNNPDLWSGQVYLRGGDDQSGRLKYMMGTHDRDFQVAHDLPLDKEAALAGTVGDFVCRPGSLVVFHPHGFHMRTACLEERRVIRVEFLRRSAPYSLLKPYFPSHCLSKRVTDNIGLFTNQHSDKAIVWKDVHHVVHPPDRAPWSLRALSVYGLATVYGARLWKRLRG